MTSRRMMLKLGVAAPALWSGTAFAQAKFTARIGHLERPTQPRHRGLEMVAALVKERTKGEVELQLFPSSQLGDARQMIEGTQFGAIQGTVMPAAFLGGFNPVISVFDIPFLLPEQREKADALRTGAFGAFVLESFRNRGLVAIALWPNGRKSMTSNKPLDGVASFTGQKFRVMDSKILIDQFGGVGAAALAVPFGELYTALQTGVVDGQENPLDTITTMKFHEVQKNLVVSNHGAMEDVVLFSPAWWTSLPEGHRKVIVDTFVEVRPKVEAMKEEATAAALASLRGYGKIAVRDLADAERIAWRDKMSPAAQAAYRARAGAEGAKALEIYATEARRLGL